MGALGPTKALFREQDVYDKKHKHWGHKAPGIVAKMMTTLKPALAKDAFGLSMRSKIVEGRGGNTKLGCWPLILKAKFQQNPRALAVLRSTAPRTLVEKCRFPRKENFWGAYVGKDGTSIVGHNVMGRLLQDIRDAAVDLP